MAGFNESYEKEGQVFPNYRTRSRLLYIELSSQFIIYDAEQKRYPDDYFRQAELLVNLRQIVSIALNGERVDAYPQAS